MKTSRRSAAVNRGSAQDAGLLSGRDQFENCSVEFRENRPTSPQSTGRRHRGHEVLTKPLLTCALLRGGMADAFRSCAESRYHKQSNGADARPRGGHWHGIRPEVRQERARSSYDERGRCCRSVLPEIEWCGRSHASLLGTHPQAGTEDLSVPPRTIRKAESSTSPTVRWRNAQTGTMDVIDQL